MKKNLFKLFSILLLGLFLNSSCSKEEGYNPLRSVPYFTKINVAQNITVNILQGDQRVEINGTGNPRIVVANVANGELFVYNPDATKAGNVIANIWTNSLQTLTCKENSITYLPENFGRSSDALSLFAMNAASVRMNKTVLLDSLFFELQDASNLSINNLQSRKINGIQKNGTRCNMQGNANTLDLYMTDGCRFNLNFEDSYNPFSLPLMAKSCYVTLKNGAYAWVYSTDYLNADIYDGSYIYYKGSPTIDQTLSNGAQISGKE